MQCLWDFHCKVNTIIFSLPWEIISQNLFAFEQRSSLCVISQTGWKQIRIRSQQPLLTRQNTTSRNLAFHVFVILQWTTNSCQSIQNICERVRLYHKTSSPYRPKVNGRAEAAVKLVKKNQEDGRFLSGFFKLQKHTSERSFLFSSSTDIVLSYPNKFAK